MLQLFIQSAATELRGLPAGGRLFPGGGPGPARWGLRGHGQKSLVLGLSLLLALVPKMVGEGEVSVGEKREQGC